jgi:Xaa-Pro aminopeptidase
VAWASRIHGQWIVDYEERINPERLRKERVERLQDQIKAHNLGALLIYDPGYVRYATGTRFQQLFSVQRFLRYAIVTQDKPPVLFELVGPELEHRELHAPWLHDRVKPAIIWQFAGPSMENVLAKWVSEIKNVLKAEGAADLPIGLDKTSIHMTRALQKANIEFVDGMPTIWDATMIKTKDEIEYLKLASAITGVAFDKFKNAIEPGVKGYELAGVVAKTLYSLGCECIEDIILASGGHTNPYLREITDKMVQPGDLVIVDIDPVGPGGYLADYARTFVCSKHGTREQKELYAECYGYLQNILKEIRPGASTDVIAEKMPSGSEEAEKHESTGLVHYAHGMGINMYEPPFISRGYSLKHPEKLKENMVLAVETYAGKKGGRQGVRLEENLVVMGGGYELLSIYPHDDRLIDL